MDRKTLAWVYDVAGFASAILIGLGTSSWLVGIGVLLGFAAIHAATEKVGLDLYLHSRAIEKAEASARNLH